MNLSVGTLNLIAMAVASAAVAYLWFYLGWRWFAALPFWLVIYWGIPILVGLIQSAGVRRDIDGVRDKAGSSDQID
jgi:fatty acid desaturase